MPSVNVPFNGQTLIIPGAYYADNVSATLAPVAVTTPPLIFLGYGYGQKPQVPATYVTPQDLLNAIRGCPASGFVPFLTNPSTQLNGAQQITFINVGENTQSSLTLYSGVTGVVNLTSANYGLPSNLLQAEVLAGTQAGKQITLYDGYSGATSTGDNLGVPFQLAYTGSASGVSYSVIVSGGVATTFLTTSPHTGESVSIPLGSGLYSTIAAVVNYLNSTGFYSAAVLSNGNLPSTNLDAITSGALASGSPYTYANVTATLGDIVYWVNNSASALATAAIASGVTSASGLAPSVIPFTAFSGAVSVAPTLSDYASGFNVALGIPGWAVFAGSNSSGVIALGTQHVVTASETINGSWRRFFSGSSTGDSVNAAAAQARTMNAFEATYVYPGIYAVDTTTGLNTLYSGHHAAAAIAGMATGNAVATPLTNKSLVGTGVEVALTVSQINQLQEAGVMPIWIPSQTGVPTVVSDLTTWQVDSNPENVFNQQVACRQFLAYSLVNAVQPYVGTQADPLTETKVLNAVKTMLNSLLYNSGNANGVLNAWDPATLKLVYNSAQQLAAITVSVQLIGQNRFITEYVSVLPSNFTINAAA